MRFSVVLDTYSRKKSIARERRLPAEKLWISEHYTRLAEEIIRNFDKQKFAEWKIEGFNIDEALYKIIITRISSSLPQYLHTIDIIDNFFSKKKFRPYDNDYKYWCDKLFDAKLLSQAKNSYLSYN